MPSTRGVTRLDTWLSKLLWILANRNKGELRISADTLDDAPDRCTVLTDYDKVTHELVIRSCSGLSEMIVVNTEQQRADSYRGEERWPTTTPSVPSPASSPVSSRSSVITDELAAQVEDRILRKAADRTRQRQQREQAEATARLNQE